MNNQIDIASLRGRIDIVQVIGHYLHLQKQGTGYAGLCPFHDDKHPSLQVSPAKGLFHCFSCGAGGDAFTFVQKREGCSFGEAVRICADICHVAVCSPDAPSQQAKAVRPVAAKAAKPVPEPTVADNERFLATLLPYDPGCEELRETYVRFEVGMGLHNSPWPYKFMRDSLVFPIRNGAGRLVAFAARYLGTDPEILKHRKYLNSKTSGIYKKDSLLYAWHEAEPVVRETGRIFITEGYKDALAMHAAGFTQTVALCGVNLSDGQLSMIRETADTVYLLLDDDWAGRDTVGKLLPRLRRAGLQAVDLVPEGSKDADEMFRRMGREAFASWVRRAMVPSAQSAIASLLEAACRRWPEVCVEDIGKALRQEMSCPEGEEYCVPYVPAGSFPELDRLYELHTEPSQPENLRRTALVRYLYLCFLETCLEISIRRNSRRLCALSSKASEERSVCIATLQHDRLSLCRVSKELRRRG